MHILIRPGSYTKGSIPHTPCKVLYLGELPMLIFSNRIKRDEGRGGNARGRDGEQKKKRGRWIER